MQIVEAVADANVLDEGGQEVYSLRVGGRYVLYDREAGFGLRDGALKLIAGLDRILPVYNRESLADHRLVLPFIGRLGDALVMASCIAALKERHPKVIVDVACLPTVRDLLQLAPRFGELLTYPIAADRLEGYNYHLSFEDVEAVPDGTRRSCADVFGACLRTPRPARPVRLTVPCEVATRWELPSGSRPRIAVHAGRAGSLRSCPRDLLAALVGALVDSGFDVYLVGVVDRGEPPLQFPSDSVHNLVNKTPTPVDLAAVLGQMQGLVTGDSFPLHLAGSLGVATLAMFTATDAVIGSDYPSVTSIQSGAACSPCRVADGPCPMGHRQCTAHRDPSISPEQTVEHLRTIMPVPASA